MKDSIDQWNHDFEEIRKEADGIHEPPPEEPDPEPIDDKEQLRMC